MQVNYGLGEKTKGPWMSEYVNFVHGIDRVLIVRETWFGYDCLKIIPQSWFVERDTKTVRDYVYSHYPFIQAEHKGKFETYLRDEINNHIGKLVVLHFTIPDTSAPKHGTGSGTSSDLQTLENKSQNINSMTNIDRIVLLLALTFHKMGKNIFDSFSMSDLYMIAGMFVIWAGSQFFGVGEVIDAALLAWLWWTIGWDCWRFLVIIINSVKTAIQATSIQQIDDAASQLAPAAAALGIDALMGFILHKFGKGSAVEEAAKKEIKTEEDLVKHDFELKEPIKTIKPFKVITENGYTYHVDELGRTRLIEGTINSYTPNAARSTTNQLKAGGKYRLKDDQGGHFIARIFNGPTDEFNHFAQNGNFNQGAYKSFENSLKKAVQNGQDVNIKIEVHYPDEVSLRPDKLNVETIINNEANIIKFRNIRGG